MGSEKGLDTLLKQAEQFYSDFDKYFKFISTLVEQLKSCDDKEFALYGLELANDRMKSRCEELGKRLHRVLRRKTRYALTEEKIYGE